ncbi:hypothetical protein GE21DRAFT_1291468 [Neurospora crassa]|nr:hypothetical protein GE21DRAFT_1291468 [Neurospora crassa]
MTIQDKVSELNRTDSSDSHMEAIGTRDSVVYRGIIGVKGEASARCLADSPRLHSTPVTEKPLRVE